MHIRFPYGDGAVEANLEWGRCLDVLDVAPTPALPDSAAALREGLKSPHGLSSPLLEHVRPGQRVLIIVSDSFRRTCVDQLLPTLLDALGERGVRDAGIRFLVATGIHRPPAGDELRMLLGEQTYQRFKNQVACHDPHDAARMTYAGTTSRGTRVMVNTAALEADHVLVTGAVVLHYFGGFGGGRKSILPGISSVEAISENHSLNLDPKSGELNPDVRIGHLDGNPVAEDMLEAGRMIKTAGIVNTVLNRDGAIAGVFVGELDAAHRKAAAFALRMFGVRIGEKADLVIASAGPPKNYVQAHKALFNAYQAVKPNGRIVLAARCEEGLGGEQFEKWLRLGSREAVIEGLRRRSEINGQTALSTIQKAPITWFVTDLAPQNVALLRARKAESLQDALERAREELATAGVPAPTCYVMPSASYTVPFADDLPEIT
ncbi:MAG TPA: nickel-dependent lactate racemase [Candidatus Hydrogenedentes bacterium]|nr:nickel-dependent lactate racemase [Candidatus Hydrogenedentota bacterium]HQM49648.1 nickel-dependent lactate racemase [Candidatus Hydrogenedentota bacterium]